MKKLYSTATCCLSLSLSLAMPHCPTKMHVKTQIQKSHIWYVHLISSENDINWELPVSGVMSTWSKKVMLAWSKVHHFVMCIISYLFIYTWALCFLTPPIESWNYQEKPRQIYEKSVIVSCNNKVKTLICLSVMSRMGRLPKVAV